MSELRWRAFRRVPWVWTTWERIWLRWHPITRVRAESLFAFRRVGDVLELHLDSHALTRMRQQPGYSTFRAVREMRQEMHVLAARVRSGELGHVTGITATTLMGEAGGVLGFEVRPLPRSLSSLLKQYFMVGLDAIYHPLGLRERAMRRWPADIWMTVETLLERYPEKSERSTTAR
jgi:YkoP-like protein